MVTITMREEQEQTEEDDDFGVDHMGLTACGSAGVPPALLYRACSTDITGLSACSPLTASSLNPVQGSPQQSPDHWRLCSLFGAVAFLLPEHGTAGSEATNSRNYADRKQRDRGDTRKAREWLMIQQTREKFRRSPLGL